jgi:hypothetical protein
MNVIAVYLKTDIATIEKYGWYKQYECNEIFSCSQQCKDEMDS